MGFGRKIGLKTDVEGLDVTAFNKAVREFSDKIADIEDDLFLVLSKHDATRDDGVVLMSSPVKIDPDEAIKNLFLQNNGQIKYIADCKIGKKEQARLQKAENDLAKKEGRDPTTIGNVAEKEKFFEDLYAEQIGILLEEGKVIDEGHPVSFINLLRLFKKSNP